ncbi:oxidoreductase [Streptomyces liangshanensis]|uniref:SDR family NAD(P)-dependent oxidoreductase n=1 Tax=Streptomyces liangshanensis TaxID=2717324 RepID=A0A6G9GWZ0_9ACTN|nr:oxidoreductase [Streptomyces liangshanensis]QIQ02521.1 SDR family NAD(P)-dependent oxidoreductase [Streptomyces liangshanensis]
MSEWSPQNLPRQEGRLAVVTGANSGIGEVTAAELARAGAEVVLAGRSADKVRAAAARLTGAVPGATVRAEVLDLADLSSVAAFAGRLLESGRPLDLLVNNAGVMAIPERRTTKDGFELTFGTNHLGHFALTGRLLPLLLKAPAPRVVTVSAVIAGARAFTGDLQDPQSVKRYRPMGSYARSKLANILFAQELQRRADAAGVPLTSVVVHPGSAFTGLQQHGSGLTRRLSKLALGRVVGSSTEEAALPSLYAATAPDVTPGGYYEPGGRRGAPEAPQPAKPPSASSDIQLATTLWTDSEEQTRVFYHWS